MTNRKFVLSMLVGFLLAGLIIIIGVALTTADGDGITDNKVYVINATYEVDDGAARQFDFKDRNVAKGSITVLTKHGGIRTVVFDPQTAAQHRGQAARVCAGEGERGDGSTGVQLHRVALERSSSRSAADNADCHPRK